jgi:ketosteroid isomerase-like protein
MTAAVLEVLDANEGFYRAFAAHDAGAMRRIWAELLPVACVHPGWDVLVGREEVLESWEGILSSGNAPEIACERAEALVLGEVSLVTCHEVLPGGRLAATNVFAREDGRWRMVHHQATPIAPGQARRTPSAGPQN